MPRTSPAVSLSAVDRQRLQAWVRAHGTPQQVALRCRIVLAAAAGHTNLTISEQCGINAKTVAMWRDRFVEAGPEGLWEIAPGRGRKPTYGAGKLIHVPVRRHANECRPDRCWRDVYAFEAASLQQLSQQ